MILLGRRKEKTWWVNYIDAIKKSERFSGIFDVGCKYEESWDRVFRCLNAVKLPGKDHILGGVAGHI